MALSGNNAQHWSGEVSQKKPVSIHIQADAVALLDLDELQIYYEIHGAGEPILLIAGYTCDNTFWNGLVYDLAKRFKVVTFDNRAVGRTKDSGQPFSIETMAMDAVMLIEHLELSRPANPVIQRNKHFGA